MQTTANVLLTLNASPIMSHAKQELEDIVAIANALVINMGTLDQPWIESVDKAQRFAVQHGKFVIFDPVGSAASAYRTEAAKRILKQGVNIVRGNASEIIALTDQHVLAKGVETLHSVDAAIESALMLSAQHDCCVVVSGAVDHICYKDNIIKVRNGTPLLTKVTGMGCSATAMIGAFASVNNNPLQAAAHAMVMLGVAADKAEKISQGPGSFSINLLDRLYHFSEQDCQLMQCEFQAHVATS